MERDFVGVRAFVTGVTGFLGYAIARALRARGAEVVALVRGTPPKEVTELGVEVVHGDLHDVPALDRGLARADVAFHVAADVRMSRSVWAEVHRTNVEGTRVVLDRAKHARVKRLVFTSSGSTLGKPLDATHGPVVTIDETNSYNFGHLGWVYPHTKWLAEELSLAAASPGFEVIVTHPTAIFGPWDFKHNLLPLFQANRGAAGLIATGGFRTVCDVRDVADGHLAAALRGRSGERYALAGEAMSVKSLLEHIARETSGRAPVVTLPAGIVRTLGRAAEAIGMLRDTKVRFTEEMAVQSCLRVAVSSRKAERELGYRSRPAAESIRDAAEWYRAQGLL